MIFLKKNDLIFFEETRRSLCFFEKNDGFYFFKKNIFYMFSKDKRRFFKK